MPSPAAPTAALTGAALVPFKTSPETPGRGIVRSNPDQLAAKLPVRLRTRVGLRSQFLLPVRLQPGESYLQENQMNRDQKAAFIDDVAGRVGDSEAIFAIDYRGITVAQVAALRTKLGESGASFQVVKNTLTSIALDNADGAGKSGVLDLKAFLAGPTAFTYVTGDIAVAAKTIADFTKEFEILAFKGGIMEGQVISTEQFDALTKLPSRHVLNGQLVGMIATPLTGLARGLGGLLGGLAIQLGAIRDQGLVTGDAPAAKEAPVADETPVAEEAAAEPAADEPAADEPAAEEPAADEPAAEEAPAEEAEAAPDAE
jgi:large subunit ribosomal protein L10